MPVVRHVLRFFGLPGGEIRVVCDNCVPTWARTFEPGHTDEDWRELSRQHSGPIHVEGEPPGISVAGRDLPRYPVRTERSTHGRHREGQAEDHPRADAG